MINYLNYNKILIISCNAGGGHAAAANALEDHIKKTGEHIQVFSVNLFELIGKKVAALLKNRSGKMFKLLT